MRAFTITEKLIASKKYRYSLFSDIHIDCPHFQKERFLADMQWCKDNDCRIMINGDLYDAILLRDMKRATVSRMEASDGQLNVKIQKCVDLLLPFVENIVFIGRGNHEESVMKYNGLDLTQMTVFLLNQQKKNGTIINGGYKNFLRIGFSYEDEEKPRYRGVYDMFIHHGSGGSAPVTKGVLDFNRISSSTMADLYWIGHKHNSLTDNSMPIQYITRSGNIAVKNRKAIMTPSYTDQVVLSDNLEFTDGYYGVQAKSGFGLLTLQPKRPRTKDNSSDMVIEVELTSNNDKAGEQIYGECETY